MRRFLLSVAGIALCVACSADPFIFAEGDSITYGYGLSPVSSNWVGQLATSYPLVTFQNNGVSGKRWETGWTPHAIASETTSALASHSSSAPRTVIVWLGVNDIAGGNSYAATSALVSSWLASVRAADPSAKVIGCTVLKYVGMSGAQETIRGQLNTFIKDSAGFDYTVDLAAVANLSDPSNTTYFNADGVHLTIAGETEVYTSVKSVLLAHGLLSSRIATTRAATVTNFRGQ